MKGGKKSRLAERINRSRQLRQQLAANGSIASQSAGGGISGSNASVTSSTDNLSIRSSTEEDETPALRQSHSVPDDRMSAADASDSTSLQTSQTFAAGRSASTRAKRFTLVEKRRKAMQRTAIKSDSSKPPSVADSAEEKRMEDAVPDPELPHPKPKYAAMHRDAEAPPVQSTAKNTRSSPPRKNLAQARSISSERRQPPSPVSSVSKTSPGARVAAPIELQQPSLTATHNITEEAKSEVNTNVGNMSEASTSVSAAISRAMGDDFGKPVVAAAQSPQVHAQGFQPLHKQYQTGKALQRMGRPTASSPPRGKDTTSAHVAETAKSPLPSLPPTTKSPLPAGGAAPSRGRSVLVANALKKQVTKTMTQKSPLEKIEKDQDTNMEEDTPKTELYQRTWNMSTTKAKFGESSDATKPGVSALPSEPIQREKIGSVVVAAAATLDKSEPQVDCDTEKEVPEEMTPKKPSSFVPSVSVSAMKARFGSTTPVLQQPTTPAVETRKDKAPSWANGLKLKSPFPTEKAEEDQDSQPDTGDGDQPKQEEESSRQIHTPLPIWAQRRGLSPVPGPVQSRPVSSGPSWVKPKWQTGDPPPPPPPRGPSPSVEKLSRQGVLSRSMSASPVPHSRPVVATPSWVRPPGSPSDNAQEEVINTSASLPSKSDTVGRVTPTWGNVRAASPQTVRTQVTRSTTPTWVKPQADDESEALLKTKPDANASLPAPSASSTLSWLQQKQQIVSRSGEGDTTAPAATFNSTQGNDRTMKWLQKRRQPTNISESVNNKDDVVGPAVITEEIPQGISRTKGWLQQKQQIRTFQDSEHVQGAVEASQFGTQKTSCDEDNRTKSWLQQKQLSHKEGTSPSDTTVGGEPPSWVKQQQRVLSPQPVTQDQVTVIHAYDTTPSWAKLRGSSPVALMKQPSEASRSVPSWAKSQQCAQYNEIDSANQHDVLVSDGKPETLNSGVGGYAAAEQEEPSRFASAYVQRIVAKPADAVKPQARKESPTPVVAQATVEVDRIPIAHGAPPFRPSHKSSWSKYNRSGSDTVSEASTTPPPNSGMEVGPSEEEFTPSQLRARFRALDQRNRTAAPVANKARGTCRSQPIASVIYDEELSQYDDPPLAYLSETETDINEQVVSERITIETPKKVVVSTIAGRFGGVRGKGPKKTPPRVVRPNDFWRSPVREETPEPSSHVQVEPQRCQSALANDDQKDDSQKDGSVRDEMPSWLKRRMKEEIIVTSSGSQTDERPNEHDNHATNQTSEQVSRPMPVSQTSNKEKDTPWWFRPKQGDEGIKRVFQRAVPPEPIPDRGLDLEIEEKTSPMPPPQTERQRRLDELLEMQIASSSESDTEMDRPVPTQPIQGQRRLGVIHTWQTRSLQESGEDTKKCSSSPPTRSESDTIGCAGKPKVAKNESGVNTSPTKLNDSSQDEHLYGEIMHESLHGEENLVSATREQPAYSKPIPQFEDDEEYPEVQQNGINQSLIQNTIPNVTPQPWRNGDNEPDQSRRFQSGSTVSGSRFESPGPSPVKPPDAKQIPSYEKRLSTSPTASRNLLRIPALSPEESNNMSGRAPFDESITRAPFDENTMVNDTSDLVIVEPDNKETQKRQTGRFALIRATASSESIELEPVGGTFYGSVGESFEIQNEEEDTMDDRGCHEHPRQRDINEGSPFAWQTRSTEETGRQFPESDDYAEEKKSTQGDDAPTDALSPYSLSRLAMDSIHAVDFDQAVRALERKSSISHDDDRSRGTCANIPTTLPPEFANSLSKGVLHDTTEEAPSNVALGEPVTYGKEGSEDDDDVPAVSDRAKAIEDWKTSCQERSQERNRHFFPDSSDDNENIFKETCQSFGLQEESESNHPENDKPKTNGARGASAVLRFWATTSKDEMDEAQDWQDCDPDIDEYSDTEVPDDTPENATSTTRLVASTYIPAQGMNVPRPIQRSSSREDLEIGAEKPENPPPAELDPFSLETFAALNSSTPAAKKSKIAFDPFGDAFGDSVDFTSLDPEGLFAPSSATDDMPSKKNVPTIAGPKKDTKPINDTFSARKRSSPMKRAETPSRTDAGLPKMLGTPPRSPTRHPLNVNQIHEELNSLDQKHDYSPEKDKSVLIAPSGGSGDESDAFSPDAEFAPRDENVVDGKASQNRELEDSVWSFEQGLPSYDNQDRYDADIETIDMATLDDSHPCEI